jgi:hypothetical protein
MQSEELMARYYIDDFVRKSCPPTLENFERYKDAISVLCHKLIDLSKDNESIKCNYKKLLENYEILDKKKDGLDILKIKSSKLNTL